MGRESKAEQIESNIIKLNLNQKEYMTSLLTED